jgi:hypothetical protein
VLKERFSHSVTEQKLKEMNESHVRTSELIEHLTKVKAEYESQIRLTEAALADERTLARVQTPGLVIGALSDVKSLNKTAFNRWVQTVASHEWWLKWTGKYVGFGNRIETVHLNPTYCVKTVEERDLILKRDADAVIRFICSEKEFADLMFKPIDCFVYDKKEPNPLKEFISAIGAVSIGGLFQSSSGGGGCVVM